MATAGQVLGLQIIIQDITERKQAEQALNESNASLRRANQDLEQFAFSASHDLQEPLRAVVIYSQMLKKELGACRVAAATSSSGMRSRALSGCSNSFGTCSLTLRHPCPMSQPPEPVSAKAALEQAIANLRTAIGEAAASHYGFRLAFAADAQRASRPTLSESDQQWDQVSPVAPLQIHISAVPHDGRPWLFRVQDNGIGIDPQYQQQVFGIFKRLHGPEEYPGTGMGLAICRRILEQHGGRIWVESKAGEGATFLFTIPAAINKV